MKRLVCGLKEQLQPGYHRGLYPMEPQRERQGILGRTELNCLLQGTAQVFTEVLDIKFEI